MGDVLYGKHPWVYKDFEVENGAMNGHLLAFEGFFFQMSTSREARGTNLSNNNMIDMNK